MSPDTPSSSSATSTPPELPYRLKISATGHGLVEVAGLDLSGKVAAVAFDAKPHNVSRLTLQLTGDTDLEGMAQVTVVRPGSPADALAAIDPDELEAEALRRLESFDDRTATAVMLEVLGEWLRRG